MVAKKRTWRVYEELPDGTERTIETGLTEQRAAEIVGDLCDEWEAEHCPEGLSDEEYDEWRQDNMAPFWSEEEDQ